MLTPIPEVTSHTTLLQALDIIRREVEGEQEDITHLAAWSREMAQRVHGIGEELQALDVDVRTTGHMALIADLLDVQSAAAGRYRDAADASVQQALLAQQTARAGHDRIQQANDDADVPMAKPAFYDAE